MRTPAAVPMNTCHVAQDLIVSGLQVLMKYSVYCVYVQRWNSCRAACTRLLPPGGYLR